MATEERNLRPGIAGLVLDGRRTCPKAHHGEVGKCVYCERDFLQKRIDVCVEKLDCLLGEMSGHSLIDSVDFEEISRVRDLLATGECKPDSPHQEGEDL